MTTKYYLSQIERFEKMIQNKLKEIEQLETIACGITIPTEKERIQKSSEKDRIGSIVSKIADLRTEVEKLIDNRFDIIKKIDGIKDISCYEVLTQRYIFYKDFKVISLESGISSRNLSRIHSKAIKEFEKMYGDEYIEKESMDW